MSYRADFGNPKQDLVKIEESEFNIVMDIKYATKDNFTGVQIYSRPFLYIHKDILPKFKLAIKRAKDLGYTIKVFDGFRPYEAQKTMWNIFMNPDYVSNPDTGPCGHCRGAAIDLTLMDIKTGKELDMGTAFDSMETQSHQDAENLTAEVLKNRVILSGIMLTSGFVGIRTEWWHFQVENMTNIYPKYKAADLDISLIEKPSQK